jgi:hypothetical protein
MTKQEFIDTVKNLQDQSWGVFETLVDQIDTTEATTSDKISIGSDTFHDIVHRVAQEIETDGFDLISDYDLEMHGNEVTLEGIDYYTARLEESIRTVLEDYFDLK